jgi:hypothetical protein
MIFYHFDTQFGLLLVSFSFSNTMKRLLISLFYLAVVCAAASCTSGLATRQDASAVGSETAYLSPRVPDGYHGDGEVIELVVAPVFPEGVTAQSLMDLGATFSFAPEIEALNQFPHRITTATPWETAHKEARRIIEQTRGTRFACYVQQTLSTAMLRSFMVTQKPTPQVQETTAYYLEILLSYNNYNEANLQALVLPMLHGYWSNAKLAQTAEKFFHRGTMKNQTPTQWLPRYFTHAAAEMAKSAPQKYPDNTARERLAKVMSGEFWQKSVLNFPKRTRQFTPLTRSEMTEYYFPRLDTYAVLGLLMENSDGKLDKAATEPQR